ncbi:SAV_6107 family HEPN domain-containing protein [Nocardioides sp. NPDC059952]|uniref:SAV_6107 family HEPN domain-containing protein n=1 Tax=Nocardioides sp. NPDC059952 TaxID=3347014 RepID=UPI003658BD2A
MSEKDDPMHLLPATTHSYLFRATETLAEAIVADDVPSRYAIAHVAALQAAAALIAARADPVEAASRAGRRRPWNAWVRLKKVAPELSEWADYFAAGAAKRAAAEAGSIRAVTAEEADEQVRDADRFLAVVEESLGLVAHTSAATRLGHDRLVG